VVTTGLSLLPFGGILQTIVLCHLFVIAPAAVVERLGVGDAMKRSGQLTAGRRWGIFGMVLLVQVVVIVSVLAWVLPLYNGNETDLVLLGHQLKRAAWLFVGAVAILQLFTGIMQAVSYALLREDKDGVSTQDLAKVFE
jgi:hypothetical protein